MAVINVDMQRDWSGMQDAEFTLESTVDWLSTTNEEGGYDSGSTSMPVGVHTTANPSTSSRTGEIIARSKSAGVWQASLPVTQDAAGCSLTYDLDGGSMANYYGGTPPGNYMVGHPLIAPTTVPTKSGHIFSSWYYIESGELVESMSPGDSHYGGMPDAAVTLKANWYEGEGGNPYLTIGGYAASTYTFPATGDTTTASINSSGDWQIIKDLAFGTTSEQHGGSGDAVTIEVQENDGDERTDTIVLSNNQGATLQVNIKQLAAPQSPNADLVVFLDNQITGDHPFVEMTFTIKEWYEDGSSSTSSSGKIEPNNGSACVSIQRPAGKWVVAALVNGHIQYSNVPGTVGLMVTSGGSGGAAYTPQNDYTFSFSADTVNGGMTMVAYYTNYAG